MRTRLFVILAALAVPAAAQTAAPALTTIYSLAGGADGANPQAPVTVDKNGVLYGTTMGGGSWGKGSAFSLTPPAAPGAAWTATVLHTFQGRGDGANPVAPLTVAPDGVIYGTSIGSNGISFGNIFSITPPATPGGAWIEKTLWNCTIPYGIQPLGQLLLTKNGSLIGTTQAGGAYNSGTVFALQPPAPGGPGWTYTILHSFNGAGGFAPGARLLPDKTGALYSTTYRGGASNAGTIFKLAPPATAGGSWTETVLYEFTGTADGANPASGLTASATGTYYGTTQYGGAFGAGTIYALSPATGFTVLYSFQGGLDGAQPFSDLVLTAGGALLGTTSGGGAAGAGTVFALVPSTTPGGAWTLKVLYGFSGGSDGASPVAGLTPFGGALYGTTSAGGTAGLGSVFQLR